MVMVINLKKKDTYVLFLMKKYIYIRIHLIIYSNVIIVEFLLLR